LTGLSLARLTGCLRLGRRPPFTLALVGLVVLLTGLTGAVIGGLAWREQRTRRALLDAAMAQAARLTAAHAARVFENAEATALFGAPFGRPDDAERAVRCVAAMQEALASLNADNALHGLPP